MTQFLEVGKYYYAGLYDDCIGEYKIPFLVLNIEVCPLADEDSEPFNIQIDKDYRTEKGAPNYKSYDIAYGLLFGGVVDDNERKATYCSFLPIIDLVEIEKAKKSIEEFCIAENEYLENMASKYPEY